MDLNITNMPISYSVFIALNPMLHVDWFHHILPLVSTAQIRGSI
jgi:hypothetical protein